MCVSLVPRSTLTFDLSLWHSANKLIEHYYVMPWSSNKMRIVMYADVFKHLLELFACMSCTIRADHSEGFCGETYTVLEQINTQTTKQTKVTIQRRRSVLEDDVRMLQLQHITGLIV
ncbi:hypothetical protein K7X08_032641 [Anisodus acutangulus]|uniref:Uncharacterized protein n=1 Tax=Anisodus acutangulus TaxID=402998 RepID=A0A9Q1LXG1_9SOLA|nr:hypothetical protein K7X08_032641 [Anisodus acutangulus]